MGQEFVIGTATAAYQIEGAIREGGRGKSVWDTFCERPGAIVAGHSGENACDHYHRFAQDVSLMADLGVNAYRLSIAWTRIQPTGSGKPNRLGLEFYQRLLELLAEKHIAAYVTLFHWDLPQALQDSGGWQSRDTSLRFADYAQLVGEHLGSLVDTFFTLNEPNIVTLLGHALGVHAPGLSLGFGALPVAHHQLLGHGLAVQALRSTGEQKIGIVNNHSPIEPATDSDPDLAAADFYDALYNHCFSDPVLAGQYPAELDEVLQTLPPGFENDLSVISAKLDCYGLNYYNPTRIKAPSKRNDSGPSDVPFEFVAMNEYEKTAFGWPVVPEGLTKQLKMLSQRYENLPPVYVTENGCAYDDLVVGGDAGAQVDDEKRIKYLDTHFDAVFDAAAAGVDVRGFFIWTLLDNFEWAEGFTKRFGLIHTDFDTMQRLPKKSYYWLQDEINSARLENRFSEALDRRA